MNTSKLSVVILGLLIALPAFADRVGQPIQTQAIIDGKEKEVDAHIVQAGMVDYSLRTTYTTNDSSYACIQLAVASGAAEKGSKVKTHCYRISQKPALKIHDFGETAVGDERFTSFVREFYIWDTNNHLQCAGVVHRGEDSDYNLSLGFDCVSVDSMPEVVNADSIRRGEVGGNPILHLVTPNTDLSPSNQLNRVMTRFLSDHTSFSCVTAFAQPLDDPDVTVPWKHGVSVATSCYKARQAPNFGKGPGPQRDTDGLTLREFAVVDTANDTRCMGMMTQEFGSLKEQLNVDFSCVK